MVKRWDHVSGWHDLEADRVDSTCPAYRDVLSEASVARVEIDEDVAYWGVFAFDQLAQVAADVKTFSNVTPLGGPRILPLQSDPPEHTAYRRMLNPFFSAERISRMELECRPIAAQMIESLTARGTADFAQDFAYPFPTRVLCRFLGMPDSDWPIHQQFVTEIEQVTGHGLSAPTRSVGELSQRFLPYILGFVRARREQPGEDVLSGIIRGDIDGKCLDDLEGAFMVMTLMMAGHITTTSAIGNLVLRLARDSRLQAILREYPERIADAVEEGLRIDTPQQAMPRRCTRNAEVGGQAIREGEYLLLNFGSANVDPKHWSAPETFDIDRKDKRHVAFGRGIHGCVGQALARMELRIVTQELLSRTDSFELAGQVRRHGWPRHYVENMPLTLVPRGGNPR